MININQSESFNFLLCMFGLFDVPFNWLSFPLSVLSLSFSLGLSSWEKKLFCLLLSVTLGLGIRPKFPQSIFACRVQTFSGEHSKGKWCAKSFVFLPKLFHWNQHTFQKQSWSQDFQASNLLFGRAIGVYRIRLVSHGWSHPWAPKRMTHRNSTPSYQ